MSSFRSLYYHLIFCPKYRTPCLTKPNRIRLYKFICGVVTKMNGKVIQINGVEDHIHILLRIHPSSTVSETVKKIKVDSHRFIIDQQLFPQFQSWQKGYGIFTFSDLDKDRLVNYVKNQEVHHMRKSFLKEYKDVLNENNVDFEEKYLP